MILRSHKWVEGKIVWMRMNEMLYQSPPCCRLAGRHQKGLSVGRDGDLPPTQWLAFPSSKKANTVCLPVCRCALRSELKACAPLWKTAHAEVPRQGAGAPKELSEGRSY